MSFELRWEEIRSGFERSFWVANVSEIFERLAYYGSFASLANYLRETLNFPTEQTGTLTGIFGGMVWFLAIFGGAAADRLGFRRALSLAYLILTGAYFLLASIGATWLAPIRGAVPPELFVGFILVLPALGISLVKPSVVGTTARSSKEKVRSLGYSIYYTMVNLGGASGPLVASFAHRHLGAGKIISGSNFQVGRFAFKNADMLTRPFRQRSIIGEAFVSCRRRAAMRFKDQIESKSLWRLHDPQAAAIKRLGHCGAVVDGFHGIRRRDTRNRRAAGPTGANGAVDQRRADKRTSGIMDKNESGAA